MACVPSEKARWGRDGAGGKKYKNAFPLERLGPLRAGRDRRAAAGRAASGDAGALRALAAEIRGFFPLKKSTAS